MGDTRLEPLVLSEDERREGIIVSGKWSTPKRCTCKDPGTGRELGRTCPRLTQRRHGTIGYSTRIPTTSGVRELRRFGFATKTAADDAAARVWELLKLAADSRMQARIGDLIFEKTARGGELPIVEDVRRRLGLRRDPDGSETVREAWAAWLAGKKRLRVSSRKRIEEIGEHWVLPVLGDVALDRVTGEHCAMVFERIDMFNEEIEAAREAGREPALPGDVRQRAKLVGVATQHRVFDAMRGFLNHAWKKAHKILFNPVCAVELEPEARDKPLVWTPAQVARFLEFTADDRLFFLWWLALLRGFRRGELAGMADEDMDLDAAAITVNVALAQIGSKLVWGKPKSSAGERVVGLDNDTVAAGRAHRARRKRERLAAGEVWQESGRMFTREDGVPLNLDYISRRFKGLAAAAELPVIKFHAARHTAATLALQAKVDIKIVSEQLGHSTTRITQDLYQQVSVQLQIDAAETTVALLKGRAGEKTGTGS